MLLMLVYLIGINLSFSCLKASHQVLLGLKCVDKICFVSFYDKGSLNFALTACGIWNWPCSLRSELYLRQFHQCFQTAYHWKEDSLCFQTVYVAPFYKSCHLLEIFDYSWVPFFLKYPVDDCTKSWIRNLCRSLFYAPGILIWPILTQKRPTRLLKLTWVAL